MLPSIGASTSISLGASFSQPGQSCCTSFAHTQRRAKALSKLGPGATEFVLLRHGETDWNKEHRLQGQSLLVPGLNELGRQQAQAVRNLGLWFSSPSSWWKGRMPCGVAQLSSELSQVCITLPTIGASSALPAAAGASMQALSPGAALPCSIFV